VVDRAAELILRDAVPDPIGAAVLLMADSAIHRTWTALDIRRLIVPPIELRQCMFAVRSSRVVGFCSWALFSLETTKCFINRSRPLQPADWNGGDDLWIVDFIAPFGDARDFAASFKRELCRRFSFHSALRAIRGYPGRHRRVITLARPSARRCQ
jgi:cytolysin-activating lysine-acyltransferase